MDKTIVCEQYTPTTFNGWTDGPKYLFDTNNLSDKVNLDLILSTFTIKSEHTMKTELGRFALNFIGTLYFINDERMAGIAKTLRPDMDVRLVIL